MTPARPLGWGEVVVRPGSHLLGFFNDPSDLDLPGLRFLEAGLVSGEQCLWICSDPERIRRVVERFGHTAGRFLGSSAFALASFRELYFPETGSLDRAAVTRRWAALAGEAGAQAGFNGLRVFAEVDVRAQDEVARMLDYEADVGHHLHALPLIAACLYPRPAMSAEALRRLRGGHDAMVAIEAAPITLFETHARSA